MFVHRLKHWEDGIKILPVTLISTNTVTRVLGVVGKDVGVARVNY